MTSLDEIFTELGLSHYLEHFVEQGFDSWQTILDITEADFDALGIKLGHRRKIQRKIANSRGISSDKALESRNTPLLARIQEETQKLKPESKEIGAVQGIKRKYRRHPKQDENAPERPPSAYVIFSNKMREELKGRNLSFTEIAKLVGERWQNLSPTEKEQLEQQAFLAKERYSSELLDYKKTDNYKKYSTYLADFKARHSGHNSGEAENLKRPRLDNIFSSDSSPGGCSIESRVASQHTDHSSTYSRSDSIYSVSTPSSTTFPWPRIQNLEGSPALGASNTITLAPVKSKRSNPASPSLIPPTIYPSCQTILHNNSHERSDSLPWKDSQRDDNPNLQQLMKVTEKKEEQADLAAQTCHMGEGYEFCHEANQNHQFKFEKHEHINKTSPAIDDCKASQTYFSPQTPKEPTFDEGQQRPLQFDCKFGDKHTRQLPPLISPNYSSFSQAPHGKHNLYQHQHQPSLNYLKFKMINGSIQNLSTQGFSNEKLGCVRELISHGAPRDIFLDSVSSLLRSKKTVNQSVTERY